MHLLPHFLEGDWGPELGALEQTILLAHATLVRKGQAMTDLVPAEAAPFVEMVMAQRGGTKLGSRAARLMMARKESARSRTAERGIVTFEALVEEAQGRWHGQATEGGTGVRGSAEDVDDSGQGDEGVRVCWDLAGAFAIWTPLAIQVSVVVVGHGCYMAMTCSCVCACHSSCLPHTMGLSCGLERVS